MYKIELSWGNVLQNERLPLIVLAIKRTITIVPLQSNQHTIFVCMYKCILSEHTKHTMAHCIGCIVLWPHVQTSVAEVHSTEKY